MAESLYEKIMQRAFRLLSYKPRTIVEMRGRLLEKEWADAETVELVINRLQELNYLNDETYASNFASSRLSMKPLGPARLRRDLQLRKLPPETVEATLTEAYAERPEEDLIASALAKRIRLKGFPTDRAGRGKLIAWLMRRGFSYDLAMRKLREISGRNQDAADQDLGPDDDQPFDSAQ